MRLPPSVKMAARKFKRCRSTAVALTAETEHHPSNRLPHGPMGTAAEASVSLHALLLDPA